LPIIFVHCRQGIHDCHQQIVGNHLSKCVGADLRALAVATVNGLPDVESCNQGDQSEDSSGEKIEAVRQIILNSNINDVPIFFHACVGIYSSASLALWEAKGMSGSSADGFLHEQTSAGVWRLRRFAL